MKRTQLAAATIVMITLAVHAFAQSQHANNARGFNATGAYSGYNIDHVNLFNGNLVIAIPLGQTYPVNGGLSYSFKLIYNSFIWSRERVCKGDVGGYSGEYWSITGRQRGQLCQARLGSIVCTDDPSEINFEEPVIINDTLTVRQPSTGENCQSYTTINPANNAGVGWQVHLGKIYRPRADLRDAFPITTESLYEVYQSPDGSDHQFYKTLHEDDPAGSPDIFYTRDSSYLRMRKNLNPSNESYGTAEYSYTIEFPNGEKHYFQRLRTRDGATLNGQTQYLPQYEDVLVRIDDLFGNSVWVNYFDDGSGAGTDGDDLLDNRWEVTDSVGRRHKFYFFKSGGMTLINSIEVESINGTKEYYNLNYAEQQPTDISVPYALQSFGIPGYNVDGSGKMPLPYLTAVVLPDGSRYSMPFASSYLPTIEGAGALAPGALIRMTLPTGGRIEWDYDKPDHNTDGGYGYYFSPGIAGRQYARLSPGVRKRRLYRDDGTLLGTWRYDPLLGPLAAGCTLAMTSDPCGAYHLVNRVTEPTGDYTDHYFSVYPHPGYSRQQDNTRRTSLTQAHVADYGLPFSKDPRNVNDAELAPIMSDHSSKPLFISSIAYNSAGVIKRKTYVRYEGDKYAFSNGYNLPSGNNPRMVASRTVFRDDPANTYAEVQYSNFDGLGHYRTTQTHGNIGNDGRFEVTQYNLDRGTYLIDPLTNSPDSSAHTYTPFPESRLWVLGNYEKQIASQGGQRSTTWFNFNQKGQLLDKRIRKDFEPAGSSYFLGDKDVLIHYGYDNTNGNLISETYYGGGKQGRLNTMEAFPALAVTAGEYRISYGHQCQKPGGVAGTIGVTSSKIYLTPSGAVTYKEADDIIDCSTGLTKASQDNSGVTTEYAYGPMGRITYIKNQQGSYDQIDYQPHGANGYTGLPKVTVTRRPNPNSGQSSTLVLSEEIYIYDGLGRLITEKKGMPGGGYQARQTTYNAKDWVTSKSEWIEEAATAANKKTTYELFDPFGRAAKITLPDNSIVWMAYKGVREVSRTVSIGTSISSTGVSAQDSTTTEVYDRHGRLTMVTQPSGSGGQDGTWSYFYNVNGQIGLVSSTDPSPGGVGQNRTFDYDNLGNLMTESHPERPSARYDSYDTMGKVGTSYDGVHQLSYSYDSAGRPTTVSELSQAATWRPVKEFSYYPANASTGGTFAPGKLATATRHNYVLNPYEYNQNYALASNGATAVASSTYSAGYDARFVIDGTRSGAGWGTNGGWNDGTTNAWPDWVEVRFSGSKSINQINVYTLQDNYGNPTEPTPQQTFSSFGIVDFQVQYWNGSSWVTVPNGSVVGNNLVWRQFSFSPITTDRIRVNVTKALNSWSRITEIEAFGSNPTVYDVAVSEQYIYSGLDGRVSKRTTSTNIPGGARFEQSFAYDQLGNLAWQTYPKCLNAECVNSGVQRPWTASYAYANGLLTGVGGGAGEVNTSAGTYATSITYNINGTVATVAHRNGVVDRMAMDLNYMQRPRQLTATLGTNTVFDTGPYSYDGSGNITRIGSDWYVYDKVGRVKEGTALLTGLTGDPTKRLKQQYDYDGFGNRTQTRTYNAASLTGATLKDTYIHNVNSSTNRLSLNYDAAGNLLGMPNAAPLYSYDAFNMIVTAPGLTYLYGPDEERFWIIDTKQNNLNDDNEETYTLRGLDNEVLREYKVVGGNAVGHWFWQKDYVYRDDKLLAAETQNGVRHYTVDHLGSPRLITDANATAYERMQFLPFGENSGFYQVNNEFWSLTFSGEAVPTRLRFTGHEKDTDPIGLTYMHARHYWERSGRFMSIDPGRDWDPKQPQSWNLYSYVRNNPMNATDPTGKDLFSAITASATAISNSIGVAPNLSRLNSTQLPMMQEGLTEMVNRLTTVPTCPIFLNHGNPVNALANVVSTINDTTYFFAPMAKPTWESVLGAGTSQNNKLVVINENGPFVQQQQMIGVPGGVRLVTLDFGTGLKGADFKALVLLHELGHQTDIFGPDAANPALNHFYTRSILEMCFPEIKLPHRP
jgi:RHS repeat-associated protein